MVKKRKKDFLLPVGVKILVQVLRSEGAEKLGYKTLYKFSSKRSVSICNKVKDSSIGNSVSL